MSDVLVIVPIGDVSEWLCFIPSDSFEKCFTLIPNEDPDEDPRYCTIKESEFSGPYNNSDTYLQSYCLDHARSWTRPGKWNVTLKGVYYLKHE